MKYILKHVCPKKSFTSYYIRDIEVLENEEWEHDTASNKQSAQKVNLKCARQFSLNHNIFKPQHYNCHIKIIPIQERKTSMKGRTSNVNKKKRAQTQSKTKRAGQVPVKGRSQTRRKQGR